MTFTFYLSINYHAGGQLTRCKQGIPKRLLANSAASAAILNFSRD
jgi:hypothetical protein